MIVTKCDICKREYSPCECAQVSLHIPREWFMDFHHLDICDDCFVDFCKLFGIETSSPKETRKQVNELRKRAQ